MLQVAGVLLKENDKGELVFLFDQRSTFAVLEREVPAIVPASLQELAAFKGTVPCEIYFFYSFKKSK